MNNIDILEEKEKEAIKDLEEYLHWEELQGFSMLPRDKHIETLLNLVETLIAENKELKENQKYIVDNYKTDCVEYEELIKRDYIPKSKVEEEIKELEKEQEEIKENEWILCSNINRIIIKVLQSLLGKE